MEFKRNPLKQKKKPKNTVATLEPPEMPRFPLGKKFNILNFTFLLFFLLALFSIEALRGSDRNINYLHEFLRFTGAFFPPDFSIWRNVLGALLETLEIAILATFFAIFISFFIAILAAQNIAPRWLVFITRMALNVIRTIPSLIWALLAVAVVGTSPLAGVIGLIFYSIGYLGKFFSEAFESVDIEVAKGLRSLGADPIQAFQFGLWPNAKPLIWRHSLWMLEYNIRSASIIGYVGAGGIGAQLYVYQEFESWNQFATVLLFILAVVASLDFLGEGIRHKIAKKIGQKPLSD